MSIPEFTSRATPRRILLSLLLSLAAASACAQTVITLGPETLRTNVKRMGINLSGQDFYDSGQMLRNLTFRNPGFEGETWQSILHCKQASRTSCTDENQYTVWPAGFLNGAHFEILSGTARGESGTILSSSAAAPPRGITLKLSPLRTPLQSGDFLLVRIDKPGRADAGWWSSLSGGASLSTEFHDLSPHSPGKQALRIDAAKPGQDATVSSYFDSLEGHSFVQLHGPYRLTFRAKPISSSRRMSVRVGRLDMKNRPGPYFSSDLTLDPGWHDYSFQFPTFENGSAVGTVELTFALHQAGVLLDDVALTPARSSPSNPTAFRDEVVEALRDLHPGVLRYMDNGTDFGSSLDNMLAPPFARQRAGSSTQELLREDIPMGLDEFLTLCEAVGAEPWYTVPPGTSPTEAANLIEYLSGPASTPYGARRAALGHSQPWTDVFPTIHLELGNEMWNAPSFAGSTLADPTVYALRASQVYASARSSPWFQPQRFDLILGAWAANTWWTGQELASASGINSVAFAPYLFSDFNDSSTVDAVFGPMFAQPEQMDSRPEGLMAQQADTARHAAHPASLAVYEVNLGTSSGSASQSAIDLTVPSLGAGLAVADHMLLMLRDLGISTQALFCLPEYVNNFTSTSGGKETMPLWGAVVDMGGATNLRRPQFLALQLVNQAILPNLIAAHISGRNPTWNQPESRNDHIRLQAAHDLQAFAFADGPRRSLILFNLSRTSPLPVSFAGPHSPTGDVRQTVLNSANITDSNELHDQVKLHATVLPRFNPFTPYQLPPHSLTVLTWTAGQPARP